MISSFRHLGMSGQFDASNDDDTSTLQADLFLQLAVLSMLMIGQHAVLASVNSAGVEGSSVKPAVSIYITDDGLIHFDSPTVAPIPVHHVGATLRKRMGSETNQHVAVFRGGSVPAKITDGVRSEIHKVTDERPYLVLVEYPKAAASTARRYTGYVSN